MASGIYTALSGAIANESRVEIISHNLANANTVGFQGFKAVLETEQGRVANQELTFVSQPEVVTDTNSGPIVATQDPLDLALFNGVYMEVGNGEQQGFVRGATLLPMEDGRVLTTEGHVVLDESGIALTVPPAVKDVRVQSDGSVLADGVAVGKLSLASFENDEALVQSQGRLILDNGDANRIDPEEVNPVMSGYLEMSNVSAVKCITDLISAQNSYSASIKMIESITSMDKKAAEGLIT